MSRKELLEECQNHDWDHMYSDDPRVWRNGASHLRRIRELHQQTECPYELESIRKAVFGDAVEKYVEVAPDEYRDPSWKFTCIASLSRKDLLTQAEINDILGWFDSCGKSA